MDYENRYCAFVDILGFGGMIQELEWRRLAVNPALLDRVVAIAGNVHLVDEC